MQCPDCGYEVQDASNFCPHCRFRFRDIVEEEPPAGAGMFIDLPERGIISEERVHDEPRSGEILQTFSAKERRQLEIQLLQPSVLVILIVALFTYSVLFSVPFVPLSVAGLNLGFTGIISLASGIVAGLVFHFLVKRSLRNSRYR